MQSHELNPSLQSTAADKVLKPGRQKLRASCDNCGGAKVRCDRRQPECRRCVSLNLVCVYGASRQFGKPPRRRVATVVSYTSTCMRPFMQTDSTHDQYTEDPPSVSEQTNALGHRQLAISTGTALPHILEPTSATCMDQQIPFDPSIFGSEIFGTWPRMNDFALQPGPNSLGKSSANENSFSVSTLQSANSMVADTCGQFHSCPRESYEIFRDLICLSADLHAPESNSDLVSAQLDEVLRCTRAAVSRLKRVLRCPCARSGHRIMVHASIISRILLWYQQAAGWISNDVLPPQRLADFPAFGCTTAATQSSDDVAADGQKKDPPTLAQSTGFVVEHVPVSMGTFNIEDQNVQAAFRDQLVLSELKKTASLIDFFTSSDSCESAANSLAAPLGAWLRHEHSRTVRILTKRLDTANESVDSF